MNFIEFANIIRQCCIDSQVINGFFVLDKPSDWNNTNVSMNAKDAQIGTFWTRAGVTANNNTIEYPAVCIEWKQSTLAQIEKGSERHKIFITVGDQYDHNECKLTKVQLDVQNHALLVSVLKRLRSYEVYQVGEDQLWYAKGDAPEGAIRTGCTINKFINFPPLNIFTSAFGTDILRSKSTEFEGVFCSELIDFERTEWVSSGGVVRCSSCG